jgi:mono/diheme cytochrome c family protein
MQSDSVMAAVASKARLIVGVLGGGFLTLAAALAQPAELPAGLNRDLVARACGACHDLDMVAAGAGASREVWKGTINEMISYGARIDPEDQARILDYLASALGPNARAR